MGLLDQRLQVQLCASNSNDCELAFLKVTASVAIGGERLASAASNTPVTLPPLASVAFPFTVSTTTRNLGDQLGSGPGNGAVRCTVSGVVVLRNVSLIGILYSVAGRVTPQMVAKRLIGMAGEPDAPGSCGSVAPGSAAAPWPASRRLPQAMLHFRPAKDRPMDLLPSSSIHSGENEASRGASGSLLPACIAEAIGTFLLVLVGTAVATAAVQGKGTAGPAYNSFAVVMSFGLILVAIVGSLGQISGAHVNPAVTLGLAVSGKFPWRCVLPYRGAQIGPVSS